jgi:hypothetical protein
VIGGRDLAGNALDHTASSFTVAGGGVGTDEGTMLLLVVPLAGIAVGLVLVRLRRGKRAQ